MTKGFLILQQLINIYEYLFTVPKKTANQLQSLLYLYDLINSTQNFQEHHRPRKQQNFKNLQTEFPKNSRYPVNRGAGSSTRPSRDLQQFLNKKTLKILAKYSIFYFNFQQQCWYFDFKIQTFIDHVLPTIYNKQSSCGRLNQAASAEE